MNNSKKYLLAKKDEETNDTSDLSKEEKSTKRLNNSSIASKLLSVRLSNKLKAFMAMVIWKYADQLPKQQHPKETRPMFILSPEQSAEIDNLDTQEYKENLKANLNSPIIKKIFDKADPSAIANIPLRNLFENVFIYMHSRKVDKKDFIEFMQQLIPGHDELVNQVLNK